VFESFTDAIFVVDSDWCLVDANARALRLLGEEKEAAELIGSRLDVLSSEVSHMCLFNGEHDIEIAGNTLVMSVRRSPLKDVKGRTVGALIHVRDVTVDVVQRRELVRVRDALAEEARANEALRAKLAEQVVRDAGTGLRNRRYVFEALPVMADMCSRDGVPLSLIILDIDRFKAVNDTYGHTVGDRALQAIATALDEAADGAVVARFGGEEFVVLLPGSSTQAAVDTAEALREACAGVEVPTREGLIQLTLSAGVATLTEAPMDMGTLLEAADGALYDAKNSGRNRVCVVAAVAA
jgi:diguanylate cyclase (GGDEF)-like protein